jgi:hypothetical protein
MIVMLSFTLIRIIENREVARPVVMEELRIRVSMLQWVSALTAFRINMNTGVIRLTCSGKSKQKLPISYDLASFLCIHIEL